MRKFKVVKKWPHGPAVGMVLSSSCEYSEYDLSNSECLEEVKEPEEFWVMDTCGNILPSSVFQLLKNVPSWNRFRTKESAEQFAKALKESYGDLAWRKMYLVEQALNDRVK